MERVLRGLSKPTVVMIGLLVIAMVAWADYETGVEARVYPLYFLPMSLVAWRLGRRAAMVAAVTCALAWHFSNISAGMQYTYTWTPWWNLSAQLGAFLLVGIIVATLEKQLQVERASSRTDALTGAANNRAFYERALVELSRAGRTGSPLSVAYLDLDNFKQVNDRQGHRAGDELLAWFVSSLQSHVRGADLVARVGGDEFALLLPDTDGPAAQQTLQKVQDLTRSGMKERGWPVTVSIGCVTFRQAPASVDAMVQHADRLMYAVKASGKNAFRHEEAGDVPTNAPRAELATPT